VRRLAAFVALPPGDRRLLLEALSALAAVRVALRFVAVERVRAWAGRVTPGTRPVDKIVWAVGVVSRQLPGTTCLKSALALQRLLSRHGHVSELHIGVAREDEKFSAHAWLTCEGRILVGELEHDRFTRLVAWKAVGLPGTTVAAKSDPA
jgi:hypothetical protein